MVSLVKIAPELKLGGQGKWLVNYGSAFVSGAVDGFLLRAGGTTGAVIFLAKNIGVPVVHHMLIKLPEGLVHHSVGQLGMAVILIAIPK